MQNLLQKLRKFSFHKIREFDVRSFFTSPSYGRTIALVGILLLVVALPVTVTVLQQRTNTQQHAANACNGYCAPSLGDCTNRAGSGTCSLRGWVCCANDTSDPCSKATSGDGQYCDFVLGAHQNGGNYELYQCVNRKTQSVQPCFYGCTQNSSGPDYCNAAPPTPTHGPNPTCQSQSGDKGTCFTNNSCGGGAHQIDTSGGKSCPSGFRVCCAKGAPPAWYDCKNGVNNNFGTGNNGILEHTSTSTSDSGLTCGADEYCHGVAFGTQNGTQNNPPSVDATKIKRDLCHKIDPQSCSCNAGDPAHRGFSCNSSDVVRSCGNGLVCDNAAKGSQSGIWPCTSKQGYIGNTFIRNAVSCGDDHAGICVFDGGPINGTSTDPKDSCENEWGGLRCSTTPNCTQVSNGTYKTDSDHGATCPSGSVHKTCCEPNVLPPSPTNNDCTKNGGSCLVSSSQGSSPCGQILSQYNSACNAVAYNTFCCKTSSIPTPTPTPAPNRSCTNGTEKGTCYTNNSCGNGMKEITANPTCSTLYPPPTGGSSYRICCAPNSGSTPTPTGSGGGGGGGDNPTPTPISCKPGKATKFAMNIKLPGIGTGTFENNAPKHPTKFGSIVVKDNSGNIILGNSRDFSHKLNHANGNGKLGSERVDLATKLTCGKTYHVEVKIPGYVTLKKTITYGDVNQTLEVTENDIIPGDIVAQGTSNFITPDGKIAGDDKITLEDYNIMKTCYHVDPDTDIPFQNGSQTIKLKCRNLVNFFDYADGGTQGDEWAFNYNLWLRGFLKYLGQ